MNGSEHHFQIEEGGFPVEAVCRHIGNDYLVAITGGDVHIGAVAMAQPRPSLRDSNQRSATASVFCYLGHKDDKVAKAAAERLSAALNTNVVVTAGLHWDDLSPDGISQVIENVQKLVDQIIAHERHFTKEKISESHE